MPETMSPTYAGLNATSSEPLIDLRDERHPLTSILKKINTISAQAEVVAALNEAPNWHIKSVTEVGIGKSTLTPGNQHFAERFNLDELNAYGTTGMSSESIKHPISVFGQRLVNLWHSEYQTPNPEICVGFLRSGTISHYGEAQPELRESANRSNGSQLIRAAIAVKQERESILGVSPAEVLHFVTIDLQSLGGEVSDFQIEGLTVSEKRSMLTQLSQEIWHDSEGRSRKVAIDCLSIPVHEKSLRANEGWDVVSDQAEQIRGICSRAKNKSSGLKLEAIEFLSQEIEQLLAIEDQASTPTKRYGLAARIAVVAILADEVVHFNCRAGKDRTGLLDAEIKFLTYQLFRREQGLPISAAGGPVLIEERPAWEHFLFEVGNDLIPKLNTGIPGYKLSQPALKARIGEHVWEKFLGSSHLANA